MAGKNMMDAEQLMIDQGLDEVEAAPACKHRAHQRSPGPRLPGEARGTKQHRDADYRQDPSGEMEKAILRVLTFQCFDRLDLAGIGRADQMMPAEDLVEHDAVDETT